MLKYYKNYNQNKKIMNATKTVKQCDLKHDLSIFPNFHKSGSIIGMKRKYYGKNAPLIRCGSYIYKVTQEVYDSY